MTLLGIVLVVGLFLTGSPLFVAFGLGSTLVILQVLSLPMATIAQHMFSTMDSYVLMAVPFFMFAGNLMTEGKSSEALVDFAENMLGHLPGGVLIAGVAAGAIITCPGRGDLPARLYRPPRRARGGGTG